MNVARKVVLLCAGGRFLLSFHIIVTRGTWHQTMAPKSWIEAHPITTVAKGMPEVTGKGTSRKRKPSFENVGKGCEKRPLDNNEENSSKTLRHHVQHHVPPPPPGRPHRQKILPPRLLNSTCAPSPTKTPDLHDPSSLSPATSNAAANEGGSFSAKACAKAVDPELTDTMLQDIVYVAAMTASESAASAAATAVINALNKAYQVNVAVPSLPSSLPLSASPLPMQLKPLDDAKVPPVMTAHAKAQPSVRVCIMPSPPQTPVAIGASVVTPQTPQLPPSTIPGHPVPQEMPCALTASSQAKGGGQIEENRRKCDMSKNPNWNCQEFAIEGKHGEVHTNKGKRQLCAKCKESIQAQQKTSADWVELEEP